jgi:hypothetical protein
MKRLLEFLPQGNERSDTGNNLEREVEEQGKEKEIDK